jgi:hypothetical protein
MVLWVMAAADPALAKGPQGMSIGAEGAEGSVLIEGVGELDHGSRFSVLIEAIGFWKLFLGVDIGVSGSDVYSTAPTEELGPPTALVFHLEGDLVEATLYREASGGPLTYVSSERFLPAFDMYAYGGWYRADPGVGAMIDGYVAEYDVAMSVPVSTSVAASAPTAVAAPVPTTVAVIGASTPLSEPSVESTQPLVEAVNAAPADGNGDPSSTDTAPVFGGILVLAVIGLWAVGRRPRRTVAG